MPLDFASSDSPLNFIAHERPLYLDGQVLQSHKALVRRDGDTTRLLGVVGSGYHVVQNHELLSAADNALRANLSEDQLTNVKIKDSIAYNKRGAWCAREYAFLNVRYAVGKDMGYSTHYRGSDVGFRVIVSHAFDGSSSIRVLSGAIDFYCTNGVIIGSFDQFIQRHTAGVALPRIGERLHASINIFWTQRDVFKRWAKSDITDAVAEELITKLPNMSERLGQRVFERWKIERDDRGPTVWALFSALTYYSSHNDGAFPLRNTGEDHGALSMHKRELAVKKWVDHPLFQSVATHGRVIEAPAS